MQPPRQPTYLYATLILIKAQLRCARLFFALHRRPGSAGTTAVKSQSCDPSWWLCARPVTHLRRLAAREVHWFADLQREEKLVGGPLDGLYVGRLAFQINHSTAAYSRRTTLAGFRPVFLDFALQSRRRAFLLILPRHGGGGESTTRRTRRVGCRARRHCSGGFSPPAVGEIRSSMDVRMVPPAPIYYFCTAIILARMQKGTTGNLAAGCTRYAFGLHRWRNGRSLTRRSASFQYLRPDRGLLN